MSHISSGWLPASPKDRTGHRNIDVERGHLREMCLLQSCSTKNVVSFWWNVSGGGRQ